MQNQDAEIAYKLEAAILGIEWHALTCGCHLEILCTLPGPHRYVQLHGIGHHLNCDAHKQNNVLALWKWKPAYTFKNWYRLHPHGVSAVRKAAFTKEWDRTVTICPTRQSEGYLTVISVEGNYAIYRDGTVVDYG